MGDVKLITKIVLFNYPRINISLVGFQTISFRASVLLR